MLLLTKLYLFPVCFEIRDLAFIFETKNVRTILNLISLIFSAGVLMVGTACGNGEETETRTVEVSEPTLYSGQNLDREQLLETVSLGSCNRQDLPQEMWPFILENDPDLWIWLGDNIYGDTRDMDVLKAKYQMQKSGTAYRAFREQVPVIGIWDDHDYGVNDGGKEYPKKVESETLMLDFMDVPPEAPVRQRPGAYQSYAFGPAGRKVKVLLLDARYFRDSLEKSQDEGRRYIPNQTGDILGEAQWAWLEEELRDNSVSLFLIGSGIQFLPEDHGYEKWANFPKARQRFFDLLVATQPSRTLLMSGDRHLAELSQMEIEGLPYPLYEITASGMTHSWEEAEELNRYRQGPLVTLKNFGMLQLDWEGESPEVTVEVRGLGNEVYLSQTLKW